MYGDILLVCDFYISFHSLNLFFFSNWGKLDVPSTFHVNFCSFLVFHELESTGISIPQQLPARSRNVYSFLSSAATRVARLWYVSFGERHHAHICWAEMFDRNQNTNFVRSCLITHVSTLLSWDVKWSNFCQPTLLDQQCSSIWPQPKFCITSAVKHSHSVFYQHFFTTPKLECLSYTIISPSDSSKWFCRVFLKLCSDAGKLSYVTTREKNIQIVPFNEPLCYL